MLDELVRDSGAPHREQGSRNRFAERARRDLADPLFRNGYALMLNAAATGALGVVYWILAARYYDDADVGRGSAAISAMMLLSGFTAMNLTGTLSRFLPRAGPATRSFVLKTYLASALASGVVTTGFLLTLDHWGPSFARLSGLGPGVMFTIAVVAWGIFTLQDAVLPALRSAVWVPLENTVFGAVKIALVVGLAAVLPRDGVFLSWVIPLGVSVVAINLLILLWLAPRHVRATEDRHAPPAIRDVGRFLAGDYVGAMFTLGVVYLVPVVVAAQVGPRTNAYFFVAWIVGGVIGLLAVNMAISLTVEGTLDLEHVGANTRTALRRTVWILLPVVAATVLLARPALGIYGASYARHAAPLLQLLALSALPHALTELYFGALRAQSRTTRLAVLQGVRCVMVVGLTMPFTAAFGITGVGWAMLLSQSTTAALVVPGLLAALGRRPGAALPVSRWLRSPAQLVPAVVGTSRQAVGALRSRGSRLRAGVDRLVRRRPLATPALVLVVGLTLFLLPLPTVRVEAVDGYGLVSVLPVASLIGIGLLTLGYILTLALHRPHRAFLVVQLVVLVVCLHGVTAFVESEARFATAYQHLGFVEYIGRTGDLAPTLDARFNWPGFFAAVSFFARAAGISDPVVLLKPAPIVAELLYLVPYMFLLACIRVSWRAKWFAAFLLVVSNWVGQDYFSPQSFNFLVYLLLLAFLLRWFGTSAGAPVNELFERVLRRVPLPRPLRSMVGGRGPESAEPGEAGELHPRDATPGQRTALVAVVMGLFLVSTASHQITPFMIIAAVAALVVVGRCELTGLPLLFGVVMVSWLSFMASGYWSGHLTELFGNVGSIGSNVGASVGGRTLQSDPQHAVVQYTRLALAAILFGLAALGALRRRRGGVRDRALLVLAVAPLSAFGLQSYGGEIGLRAYLFALPALCVLVASFFFGVRDQRSWLALAGAFVCAAVLVGGFLVARYGNEAFERTTRGELAALDYVYRHDSHGARVMWLTPMPEIDVTPMMPWGARHMEKVEYVGAAAPRDPRNVSPIIRSLRELGPSSYLVINRAQLAYLQLNYSFPSDWGQEVRARLEAAPGVRRVFANRDAAVYTLAPNVADPASPAPTYPGLSIETTPWTPFGIAVTVLLLAVLVTREVLRVRRAAGGSARLAPLTRVAYVLLAGWAAVVLERFLHLS